MEHKKIAAIIGITLTLLGLGYKHHLMARQYRYDREGRRYYTKSDRGRSAGLGLLGGAAGGALIGGLAGGGKGAGIGAAVGGITGLGIGAASGGRRRHYVDDDEYDDGYEYYTDRRGRKYYIDEQGNKRYLPRNNRGYRTNR